MMPSFGSITHHHRTLRRTTPAVRATETLIAGRERAYSTSEVQREAAIPVAVRFAISMALASSPGSISAVSPGYRISTPNGVSHLAPLKEFATELLGLPRS